MRLLRLQVEEGFLDGLDLQFGPGLNVLIGPRGTGKTSVIELLRFCLGVTGYSDESDRQSREHALSVLGSGRATVTLTQNGEDLTLTRAASDSAPRASRDLSYTRPLVLSQNEIEHVGLQSSGRLRLVDGFRTDRDRSALDEKAALSLVASLTVEIASIADEMRSLDEQLQLLPQAQDALQAAITAQALSDQSLQGLSAERARLKELAESTAIASARADIYERSLRQMSAWEQHVKRATEVAPNLPPWSQQAGEDQLSPVRSLIAAALTTISLGSTQVETATAEIRERESNNRAWRVSLEDESRELRRVLETASKGAGAEARTVSELQSQVSRLTSLEELRKDRQARLRNRQGARAEALSQLNEIRDRRVAARQRVIDTLNTEFGPILRFSLSAFGSHEQYSSAIADALRGSGLHYNLLAPKLAASLTPQELAEIVETSDLDRICDLGGLTPDRGNKLLASLTESGLQHILSAPIDDVVELALLDGTEYKPSTKLSTGQRCTIVLPIVLRHRNRALVVDQPEDHLDNAFIVDTVVKAIRSRSTSEQMICATHNPNIPVLGEATSIYLMGSDGRRGFVRQSGSLDSTEIVRAITNVMEGGLEAFERRARFYRGSQDG